MAERPRHFQHALQRLDPLVAVGDAELVDQKGAVKRMHAAEDQQLVQFGVGVARAAR